LNPAGRFSTLNQKSKIDQKAVEANVYDFVNDKVESTNWIRNEDAYQANGGGKNGWGNGDAPVAKALVQT